MTSADDKNYLYLQRILLKTVYHREKHAGTEHKIEEPLNPSQRYYWTVKASNAADDDWSYYNYHLFVGFAYMYLPHVLTVSQRRI